MRTFIYKRFIHRLLQINDTPESIALGTAVGVFLAMTPTVGIQMILMIIVGTIVRANRLAGIIMVYISNPLTLIPIYWADYWIGAKLLGFDLVAKADFERAFQTFLDRFDELGLWSASTSLVEILGVEIVAPMFFGGALFGMVLGIPVYPLTLRLVRAHQRRKAHKKALLNLRDARRREREEAKSDAAPPLVSASEEEGRGERAARDGPAHVESVED